MYKRWTKLEENFLINEYHSGSDYNSIGKALGRSFSSISTKAKEFYSMGKLRYKRNIKKGHYNDLHFADNESIIYNKFLKLNGNFINASDIHCPFENEEVFNYIFKIAKKFKITNLHFNGDFLNMEAFSTYISGQKGKIDLDQEFNHAEIMLKMCLDNFERIYITQGNHESRLYRQLGGLVDPHRFYRLLFNEISTPENPKQIIISDYKYCHINDSWIVGHPSNFSEIGGATPAAIADVSEMNVITGHNHHVGYQMSKSGKYVGIDHGMVANPLKIEYYNKNLTKHKKWQCGFSMIYNNFGYVFPVNFTDWDFWLK